MRFSLPKNYVPRIISRKWQSRRRGIKEAWVRWSAWSSSRVATEGRTVWCGRRDGKERGKEDKPCGRSNRITRGGRVRWFHFSLDWLRGLNRGSSRLPGRIESHLDFQREILDVGSEPRSSSMARERHSCLHGNRPRFIRHCAGQLFDSLEPVPRLLSWASSCGNRWRLFFLFHLFFLFFFVFPSDRPPFLLVTLLGSYVFRWPGSCSIRRDAFNTVNWHLRERGAG